MATTTTESVVHATTVVHIDSGLAFGESTSIVSGTGGLPSVIYGKTVSTQSRALTIARCVAPKCSELVVSNIGGERYAAGRMFATSTSSGLPVIAFSDAETSQAVLLICSNGDCSDYERVTVPDHTGVTGVAVSSQGVPLLGFDALWDGTKYPLSMLICSDADCNSTVEVVYGYDIGGSSPVFAFSADAPAVAWTPSEEPGQPRKVPVLVSCSDPVCSDWAIAERMASPPPSESARPPAEELLDLSAIGHEMASLTVIGTECPDCAPALVDPQLALVTCTDQTCTSLATNPVFDPIPTGPDGNTWWQIEFAARLLQDPDGDPTVVRIVGGLTTVDFPPDEAVSPIEVIRCHDAACTTYTTSTIGNPPNVLEAKFDAVILSDGTVAIVHATPTPGDDSFDLNLTFCPAPACRNTQP